jgi:hypothetical protein
VAQAVDEVLVELALKPGSSGLLISGSELGLKAEISLTRP